MYTNPIQQGQSAPGMPRPQTMMNPGPMAQGNPAVGMPAVRPMVSSSPMPVSMLPPPNQGQMMPRPGIGSPYGVMNRPGMYDKNKRSVYSNDLRPQGMVPPGQPPQMSYGGPMVAHQPMISNQVPQMAPPMRQ